MLKINSQFNDMSQDERVRRLINYTHEKKASIDNILIALSSVKDFRDIPSDIISDLEYVFGNDWKNVATGTI